MFFLKLTRSAKNVFTRFGWLLAELLFVFLGLYGAFLLERMHDEKMDLLRKRQILEALVQEFTGYESELSEASTALDEGYGVPFFTNYSAGEQPFPRQIPLVGMGNVNTGIWEAMLGSGGMEVLEVKKIQEVQSFFKAYQDFLQLLQGFKELYNSFILPEYDQNTTFFYQAEGIELRDKYKWYVNQLFQMGMGLRALSEQAASTLAILQKELDLTIQVQDPSSIKRHENNESKKTIRTRSRRN
jgi:hypothetical protein